MASVASKMLRLTRKRTIDKVSFNNLQSVWSVRFLHETFTKYSECRKLTFGLIEIDLRFFRIVIIGIIDSTVHS